MIEVDEKSIKNLQSKFDSLSFEDQKGVYRSALGASANILKKQTKSNIQQASFKKNTDINKGTRHKVKVYSGTNSFARVYIDGYLRMLEGGTITRRTKKGYNRGSIKAYKFFYDARQQTEQQVFKEMESNIFKSIERKWNKRNK